MAAAAVIFAVTSHPGVVLFDPVTRTVRIKGLPAAVAGDQHVCLFPIPPGHPPNVISGGSVKVRIKGQPAARKGDLCACGALIEVGVETVNIG